MAPGLTQSRSEAELRAMEQASFGGGLPRLLHAWIMIALDDNEFLCVDELQTFAKPFSILRR